MSLFDLANTTDPSDVISSSNPMSMESAGQMFGFLLYESSYITTKDGNILWIPKVHDRAQVFISCLSENYNGGLRFTGIIERPNNQPVFLPAIKCASKTGLFILVENMGRINYGPYIFDEKGILSSVYLDGKALHGWKMIPIPFHNLNEFPTLSFKTRFTRMSYEKFEVTSDDQKEPTVFTGQFVIDNISEEVEEDAYLSFNGWGKGVAFVNEFNIGRYWPSFGPQCNLYVPAPILKPGRNSVVIFELESPHPELVVQTVDQPDFTCGSDSRNVHQL